VVLYVVLIPRKIVALSLLAACGVAVAVAWHPLTHVRDVSRAADLAGAMSDARRSIIIVTTALMLVGALLALLDGRLSALVRARSLSIPRANRRAWAVVTVLAVAAALMVVGNPVNWVNARYDDFKGSGYSRVERGSNRFSSGSLGSNRYDFYRVALNELSGHPLIGIGADNFAVPYLRHRRSDESPTYTHSFLFGTLAGLGLVGALLFAAFLIAVVVGVARAARASTPSGRGAAVAAAVGFAMFFIHGLADWLWQLPALGVLAFLLLAMALRIEPEHDAASRRTTLTLVSDPPRLAATIARRGVIAFGVLAAALSLALPGIAARITFSAYRVSATDPQLALDRLRRAGSLNFMRSDAPLAEGLVAEAIGRASQARQDFALMERAILESNGGDRREARADISAAKLLNPHQPVVDDVAQAIRSGRPIEPSTVGATLDRQLAIRLRPTG